MWSNEDKINESLRDKYKPYDPQNTPWYKDWTVWGYIIGGVAATATIIGLGYIAYSYYFAVTLPDGPGGEGLGGTLPPQGDNTSVPGSPSSSSSSSTIKPDPSSAPIVPEPPSAPIPPRPSSRRLPPLNTEGINPDTVAPKIPTSATDGLPVPPFPNTPLNPWKGGILDTPPFTPTTVGLKPSLNTPISPEKVTQTSPTVVQDKLDSLPSTPTDKNNRLSPIIESLLEDEL